MAEGLEGSTDVDVSENTTVNKKVGQPSGYPAFEGGYCHCRLETEAYHIAVKGLLFGVCYRRREE